MEMPQDSFRKCNLSNCLNTTITYPVITKSQYTACNNMTFHLLKKSSIFSPKSIQKLMHEEVFQQKLLKSEYVIAFSKQDREDEKGQMFQHLPICFLTQPKKKIRRSHPDECTSVGRVFAATKIAAQIWATAFCHSARPCMWGLVQGFFPISGKQPFPTSSYSQNAGGVRGLSKQPLMKG